MLSLVCSVAFDFCFIVLCVCCCLFYVSYMCCGCPALFVACLWVLVFDLVVVVGFSLIMFGLSVSVLLLHALVVMCEVAGMCDTPDVCVS